jgi:hypothetical protein
LRADFEDAGIVVPRYLTLVADSIKPVPGGRSKAAGRHSDPS